MGLDNFTTIVYGWKVEKEEVENLKHELEVWSEDYYNQVQNVIVEDTMCDNYIYFGAIIASYDAVYDPEEVIVNDDLINSEMKEWNKFINDNPEFANIISKYQCGNPQLYVFQDIW